MGERQELAIWTGLKKVMEAESEVTPNVLK
jgi:hypothetical protein